jgi:hypothetical protein
MSFGRSIKLMLIKIDVIRSIHRVNVNQNRCNSLDSSSRCESKSMLFDQFIDLMLIKIDAIWSIHRLDVDRNRCHLVNSSTWCWSKLMSLGRLIESMLFGRFIELMLIKIDVIRLIHQVDVDWNRCHSVDSSSRCWSKSMDVIRSIHRVDIIQSIRPINAYSKP